MFCVNSITALKINMVSFLLRQTNSNPFSFKIVMYKVFKDIDFYLNIFLKYMVYGKKKIKFLFYIHRLLSKFPIDMVIYCLFY